MSERKTERKDAEAEEDEAARGRLLSRIEKRWASAEAQHAAAFIPEAERKKTERARLLAQRLGRSVRAIPVERLVAENPSDLADDVARLMRDLKTLESEQTAASDAMRSARKSTAALADRLLYGRRSTGLEVSIGRLRELQERVADLVRGELEYLDHLDRNDAEAARVAAQHLGADYKNDRETRVARLDRLLSERAPLERAYLRERETNEERLVAMQRDLERAHEREETRVALLDATVRLRVKLEKLRDALVEKLEYEAKGEALLDDAVDEQAIEARCRDEKTSAEYRASAVCKAAREWADDVKCTVRDTGRPTSVLTHDEVEPADRIRLRFKKITGASGAGTTATVVRCFDLGSLKYLIATSRADGVAPVEPETKLPLSKAQLHRIDALPWPASDSRAKETADELLDLLESKTQTLEAVQRRQELTKRLVWLCAGSPGLWETEFPNADESEFAYTDDAYWRELAEIATPSDLSTLRQPPISDSTRRQLDYYE